jgi:hypothetical protein
VALNMGRRGAETVHPSIWPGVPLSRPVPLGWSFACCTRCRVYQGYGLSVVVSVRLPFEGLGISIALNELS